MKNYFFLLTILAFVLTSVLIFGCASKKTTNDGAKTSAAYNGTASITQGIATTIAEEIYTCERGRKTDIGEITSTDGEKWIVPAETNYTSSQFPFAADLFNSCEGKNNTKVSSNLNTIVIDEDGELFIAYIFADNYFEMFVNDLPVGKDKVPFTQFNSSVIQFKVQKPFTIAMKLVDWEEQLGVGSEANRGKPSHAGDGGMVAVIKDAQNNTIATTNKDWKAQTFYTAPITDLSCVSEEGNYRYSKNCDTRSGQDSASFYALHWKIPTNWMKIDFDDSEWPNATIYTKQTIGVDNKPAYTNFSTIFDEGQFIWSSNVVLDNEVLVRYTINE